MTVSAMRILRKDCLSRCGGGACGGQFASQHTNGGECVRPISISFTWCPPRLRIVSTQRDTDGDTLPSTVPAASPLPTWVDMSRGDDSPRVIQAVDPDTESVASSGFLRMFAQPGGRSCNDEVVDSVVPESSPSRRVVLVPQSAHGSPQSLGDRHLEDSGEAHNDGRLFADHVRLPDSDTETVGAVSDVSAHEPTVEAEVVVPVEEVTISPVLRDALRYLDLVDVSNIFQRRASVMRSPPKFLCGAFRSAMRVALQEIVRGAERRAMPGLEALFAVATHVAVQTTKGWQHPEATSCRPFHSFLSG